MKVGRRQASNTNGTANDAEGQNITTVPQQLVVLGNCHVIGNI